MTQDEIAAMQADALAGTPGDWVLVQSIPQEGWNGWYLKGQPTTLLRGFTYEIANILGPQDSETQVANARRIARLPRVEVAVTALTAQAEADQIKIEAQAVEIARLREAMSIAGPITLEDYDWNTRCYNEDQVRKIALIRELLGVQP